MVAVRRALAGTSPDGEPHYSRVGRDALLVPAAIYKSTPTMKHHFADLLDRDGRLLTMVPNRERNRHDIADADAGDPQIVVATISADTEAWKNVFTFPKLEELTLHSPSHEQLESCLATDAVEEVRITHASPKDLSALRPLVNVEELVLSMSQVSPISLRCSR